MPEVEVDITPEVEVDITPEPESEVFGDPIPTYEDVQSDYVVQKGDTLWGIAKSHNCTIAELARWNSLHKPYLLSVGQTLRVNSSSQSSSTYSGSGESYVVVKGDTLWKISRRYNCTVANLVRWNNLTSSHVLSVGQELQVSQ
jgi:LysM repeat protein